MVNALKQATEFVETDDSIDAESKKDHVEKLARLALKLTNSALESGWKDDQLLMESEHFQWLRQYPEFKQLVQLAESNRSQMD